ncbi:MAG: superoxide dismutase family protein [Elusimicrobia bacterium]|nr:superoxide dismutase family protein [Elusimicrobiota bacterium]
MKLSMKLALALPALALCATPSFAATGTAKIVATSTMSHVSGTIKLTDTETGLNLKGDLMGLMPGDHGFHVHEKGDCSDMGKAAGSHYNPLNHPHGDVMKDATKAHAGDMGNIKADTDGKASVNVTIPGLKLTGAAGEVTAEGRAIVVHEKADDFSQPAGNAGGRIGCGKIVVDK